MTTATQTEFALFPFTHHGFNFVSRIDKTYPQYGLIVSMGQGFIEMNKGMLNELIPNFATITKDELVQELVRVNEFGSFAFIELAGE